MITVPITGSLDVTRKIKVLHRVDLTENAGTAAAARVQFKDTDGNGQLYVDVRIAASDSRHIEFSPPIRFPNGCYVQVTTGTVRGSVTGQ